MRSIPPSWVSASLIEFCARLVDGSHNPPKAVGVGKPMLSARNINDFQILFDDYRLITNADFDVEHRRTRIESGDVLITIVGTIGRTAVVPIGSPPFALQRSVAVIKPRRIDARYLAYALNTNDMQSWLADNAKGTAQKGVYLKTLGTACVPIAPLAEQSRIVAKLDELLSDLDAGVAELKAAQRKLALYRQSLLKAAVEGALTADWRARNPSTETGAQLLERILQQRRARWEARQLAKFKDQGKAPSKDWHFKYPEPAVADTAALPALPSGWAWASIEQLGEVQLGRQRSPDKLKGESPKRYIRAANITEAGIDLTDVLEMDFSESEQKTFALLPGDVILTEASGSPAHVGRPAIWRCSKLDYCFQNTVLRFTPCGIGSEFAFYSFLAMQKLGVFRAIAGGVGINHLSAGKFSKLLVPLPPEAEQAVLVDAIATKLSLCDDQIALISHSLKQSAAQRKNILQAAFSGQLVPQDPSDEPASVLLARIRAEQDARSGKTAPRRSRLTGKQVS